ncbi:MAG: hypothetical protein WAV48_04590 [Candidatus Magasanikiibacteriota bacterium]
MITLSEAYKVWLKRYPTWKMERRVNGLEGFVLMDSVSQRRKIFLFVRCEMVTSRDPMTQQIALGQVVIDACLMRKIPVIVAFRDHLYDINLERLLQTKPHRSTQYDEPHYLTTLANCSAVDITNGYPRPAVKQEEIFGEKQ